MTLIVRNLSVAFPGRAQPVIDGIDLSVPDGSFTVVVGPSGCGKSTLLGCLAGLVPPTAGQVVENDVPVDGPSPRMGMVFQRDVLFPWLTVAGNLEFALRARGVPSAERPGHIGELLELVGLADDVRAQRPSRLSGGMRQRVGLARTLAGDPEILLMDEPFSALDALTRLRMQDLVVDLWERLGRTVVFVTHDVDEAIRLSDRIVVLDGGRIAHDVANTLPRPRPADRLGDLPGYSALRRDLHHDLGVGVRPAQI